MGRSGMGGGGGQSAGGRSGGNRSSTRSAVGSSGRSSSSSSAGRSGSHSSFRGTSPGARPAGGFGGGAIPGGGGRPPRRPHRPHAPHAPHGFGGGNIIINNSGNSYGEPPVYGGEPRRRRSGVFTTVLVIIAFFFIMSIMFEFMAAGTVEYELDYTTSYSIGLDNITPSTVKREKLHLNLSDASGYVTDECGWIRNKTTLIKGMQDFYESTGILPYVYIVDNIDGDYDPSTEKIEQFAREQYTALFSDEGHALLVFWDYDGAYEYTLWLGDDAAELMDQEACDILFDYIDYYYYAADTEEAFFADAFADAGKRMMTVTRSKMDYVLPVIAVIVVAAVIYVFAKSAKEKQAQRAKKAQEILNTPLEKFGSNEDVLKDLESKYK